MSGGAAWPPRLQTELPPHARPSRPPRVGLCPGWLSLGVNRGRVLLSSPHSPHFAAGTGVRGGACLPAPAYVGSPEGEEVWSGPARNLVWHVAGAPWMLVAGSPGTW